MILKSEGPEKRQELGLKISAARSWEMLREVRALITMLSAIDRVAKRRGILNLHDALSISEICFLPYCLGKF